MAAARCRSWLVLFLLAAPPAGALAQQWAPTEAQNHLIQKLTYEYLAAKDSRDYKRAYDLQSPSLQDMFSLEEFIGNSTSFNDLAGPVIERRIMEMSWYENPTNAPGPGVYVAVDLISRFEQVDRHCGFLAFHLESDGQFRIVREEENFLDRATEENIRTQSGQIEVDRLWVEIASHCRYWLGGPAKAAP